jgi:hypothetical protein
MASGAPSGADLPPAVLAEIAHQQYFGQVTLYLLTASLTILLWDCEYLVLC